MKNYGTLKTNKIKYITDDKINRNSTKINTYVFIVKIGVKNQY